MKSIIEHREYTNMTKQQPSKPPEYFGYADLKSKVGPATQRVRAIEEILTKRENERPTSASAITSSTAVESIAAVGPEQMEPSSSHSHSQQVNGIAGRNSNKPAPPPTAAKPAHLTSAAGHSPTSPSAAASTSGRIPGRISGNLAARMAALHNAGMEGAGQYAGMSSSPSSTAAPSTSESTASAPSASSSSSNTASTSAEPSSGLKRSPAIHHVSSISTDSTSRYRRPISQSTSPADSFNSDLPLPAAQARPNGTSDSSHTINKQEHIAFPPTADDPSIAGVERPDSAPPAVENGPPNASGPATTSHDLLANPSSASTSYSRPRGGSASGGDGIEARLAALKPPSTTSASNATAEDLDDFSTRFPDVDQEDFDILPSPPAFKPGEPSRLPSSSQIPKPFHPAPQSTLSSSEYSSSARTSSLSSSGTGHTAGLSNGYSSAQLQSAASSKGPPPVPGAKTHRPPLPKPPSAPSLPNLDAKTISPSDLWSYIDDPSGKTSILLIDVRTRHAFSTARIKAPKVVCLEPFTLSSNSTAGSIEVSLEISPPQEKQWFQDRANYGLIVIYDKNTRQLPSRSGANGVGGRPQLPLTFGSTNTQTNVEAPSQDAKAISILLSAIYEFNFSDSGKRLKRSPLLLVGGFEAWEKEIGEKGIYRDPAGAHGHRHHLSQSGLGDRPSSISAKEAEYQA